MRNNRLAIALISIGLIFASIGLFFLPADDDDDNGKGPEPEPIQPPAERVKEVIHG